MVQSVEFRDLKELNEKLAKLLEELPEKRRRLHEELADMAKTEVERQAGTRLTTGRLVKGKRVPSSGRRVKEWQDKFVGSKGGYAAVRAKADTYSGKNVKYAVGYITNAIESGHNIRTARGKAKKASESRAKASWVPGRYFYLSARSTTKVEARRRAAKFAEDIAERIGGSGG